MTRRAGRAIRCGSVLRAAAVALFLLAGARAAHAHTVGVSSGEYRLDRNVVYGDIGMAGRELARALPGLDTDHDGEIQTTELNAARETVTPLVMGGLAVRGDGRDCVGLLDRALASEDDGGVIFQVRFTCPEDPRRLSLSAPMIAQLSPGHRHMARLFRAGKPQAQVLDAHHATWNVDDGSDGGLRTAWSILKLGVEHILTGADHLVFLLGLILVGGRFRSLLGVITAFTLAHSITLALAALSVFAPSPRLVEPAIALSIAYVGVENLFVKDASKRWRITFPFGLIHGFGFAGALREIALPRDQVPIALVSFNLGVEVGQLAVLAIALPLTLTARNARWFGDRGVKAASIAIAIGGGVLFAARLMGR